MILCQIALSIIGLALIHIYIHFQYDSICGEVIVFPLSVQHRRWRCKCVNPWDQACETDRSHPLGGGSDNRGNLIVISSRLLNVLYTENTEVFATALRKPFYQDKGDSLVDFKFAITSKNRISFYGTYSEKTQSRR